MPFEPYHGQKPVIDFIKSLGNLGFDAGMCKAIGLHAIPAFLIDDVEGFNTRDGYIYNQPDDARAWITAFQNREDKTAPHNQQEEIAVDLLAFCKNASILHQPVNFIKLLGRIETPANNIQLLNDIASKAVRDTNPGKDPIIKFPSWSIVYTEVQLDDFFFLIYQLANKYQINITLGLESGDHFCAMRYHHGKDQWELCDANQLPIHPVEMDSLVPEIYDIFGNDEKNIFSVFSTSIYALSKDHSVMKMIFDEIESDAFFITTKKITLEKASFLYSHSSLAIIAAREGDEEIIDKIISLGVSLDEPSVGVRPIITACIGNQTAIVKNLVKHGATVNSQPGDLFSALYEATALENIELITFLLENGADANFSVSMSTALHIASAKSNDIVQVLLKHNANPNLVNEQDYTPLDCAIGSHNSQNAITLLEHGADPNLTDTNKLHVAIEMDDLKLFRLLLKQGMNKNLTSSVDGTALHLAVRKNKLDFVTALLEYNACPDTLDSIGYSALHYSIELNLPEITSCLLRIESLINTPDGRGWTPIFLAVMAGNLLFINMLHNEKADLNIVDIDNNYLIHHAVNSGNCDVVKKLMDLGIDLEVQNAIGSTPLMNAIRNNNVAMVRLMTSAPNKERIITSEVKVLAARMHNPQMMRLLRTPANEPYKHKLFDAQTEDKTSAKHMTKKQRLLSNGY